MPKTESCQRHLIPIPNTDPVVVNKHLSMTFVDEPYNWVVFAEINVSCHKMIII